MIALRALFGNPMGQMLAAVVGGFLALKAYGFTKKQEGARDLATQITKKADADVKKADDVRDAVAAGKRGVRPGAYIRRED